MTTRCSSGPGYIDPISIIGIFAFIFGVSMVYEVGLLYRTREAFLETGDARAAVRTGLTETAAAATGAAAVMLAAIIPFADGRPAQRAGVRRRRRDRDRARRADRAAGAAARRGRVLGRRSWWPLSREAPPAPAGRRGTTEPVRWLPRWRRTG